MLLHLNIDKNNNNNRKAGEKRRKKIEASMPLSGDIAKKIFSLIRAWDLHFWEKRNWVEETPLYDGGAGLYAGGAQ